MAYVKAFAVAIVAALAFGAATGIWRALVMALERLGPGDRATVLAQGISEAINTAAFLAILFVPLGLLVAFVSWRMRGRPPAV